MTPGVLLVMLHGMLFNIIECCGVLLGVAIVDLCMCSHIVLLCNRVERK